MIISIYTHMVSCACTCIYAHWIILQATVLILPAYWSCERICPPIKWLDSIFKFGFRQRMKLAPYYGETININVHVYYVHNYHAKK